MPSKLLLGGDIEVHDWNVGIIEAKAFQKKVQVCKTFMYYRKYK